MPIDNDGSASNTGNIDTISRAAPGFEDMDGADLFFKHLTAGDADPKKDQPSPKVAAVEDDPPTDTPDPSNTADDNVPSDEGEGDTTELEKIFADENAYTRVPVNGEEHEVPIKDLARLWGQEAALTQRSQQLADLRKKVELAERTQLAAQAFMLDVARKRFEPFSKIDFLELSRDPSITPERFKALRDEAQHRYEEVKFHEEHANAYYQAVQARENDERAVSAKAAVAQLMDAASPYYIEGFNQQVYDDLRQFAVKEGISPDLVNSVVDAPVIKLIQLAKLYRAGQAAAKTKSVKVVKTPQKVIKTTVSGDASRGNNKFGDKGKAMEKLVRTGKLEDATNAFMASFREFESE